MALKEIPLGKEGEQLTFKAFELASTVAELLRVEYAKKEAMEEFADQIKALKRSLARLSAEIEGQKQK